MGKFFILASVVSALAVGAQAVTKVACVGNSITYGFGLEGATTYPQHLQQILGSEYEVKNFGNSGKMFHKASSESYWTQIEFTSAYNYAPDIVVIELGTNDSKYFFRGDQANYNYYFYEYKSYTRDGLIEEMEKDYEAFIDTFAHQPQSPKIYATLQPYAQNLGWFITDTVIVNTINPIIKAAAKAKGAALIDLHEQFNKTEWLLNDVVHPNATGAKELAQIIANGILNKSSNPIPQSSSSESISSSSQMLTESSSGTEALIKAHLSTAKISTQGTSIFIENFSGKIMILDLNGNIVNRALSSGSVQIQAKHAGTYIVKAGNLTHKILIK